MDGKVRKVWLFEFKIHDDQQFVPLADDAAVSRDLLAESRRRRPGDSDDDEIVGGTDQQHYSAAQTEQIRGKLLALEPRQFELFIRDLLVHCGFADVRVTKYSSDGGIDVNARTGTRLWVLENTMLQVQARRWLHSVGRKEVAELRGSLQPFARGAVVTTGHFSKAAVKEASEEGKNPIVLVDGFSLSQVVLDQSFPIERTWEKTENRDRRP